MVAQQKNGTVLTDNPLSLLCDPPANPLFFPKAGLSQKEYDDLKRNLDFLIAIRITTYKRSLWIYY